MMNKLAQMLSYVKSKHQDIDLQEDTVGLVDADQYIILGKHKDIEDRLLLVVDMHSPKKIIILPITDTIAYFSAQYILAYHNDARNLANRIAEQKREQK